jgi:hypothetical protein
LRKNAERAAVRNIPLDLQKQSAASLAMQRATHDQNL